MQFSFASDIVTEQPYFKRYFSIVNLLVVSHYEPNLNEKFLNLFQCFFNIDETWFFLSDAILKLVNFMLFVFVLFCLFVWLFVGVFVSLFLFVFCFVLFCFCFCFYIWVCGCVGVCVCVCVLKLGSFINDTTFMKKKSTGKGRGPLFTQTEGMEIKIPLSVQ